jgi:hypothetical protein
MSGRAARLQLPYCCCPHLTGRGVPSCVPDPCRVPCWPTHPLPLQFRPFFFAARVRVGPPGPRCSLAEQLLLLSPRLLMALASLALLATNAMPETRPSARPADRPADKPSDRPASAPSPLTRMLPSFQTPSIVSSGRAARGVWVGAGCRCRCRGLVERPRAANGLVALLATIHLSTI